MEATPSVDKMVCVLELDVGPNPCRTSAIIESVSSGQSSLCHSEHCLPRAFLNTPSRMTTATMKSSFTGTLIYLGCAEFLSCRLRSSRQRAYCSALVGSGSSLPLSQKQNQSTFPCCETIRSHGFSRM